MAVVEHRPSALRYDKLAACSVGLYIDVSCTNDKDVTLSLVGPRERLRRWPPTTAGSRDAITYPLGWIQGLRDQRGRHRTCF